MSSNVKGALFALLAFAIFATHDVFVKILGGVYSPFQIIFFSVLLSFPLAAFTLMSDREPGTLRPVHPWWMALRTGAAVMTGFSVFYAFSTLPLAQVYAILFATPLLITVLAIPILGETVRMRRWAAVLVGLIGVLVVLRPGQTDLTLGHLGALVGAVGGGLASIIVRKIGAEERPVLMMLHPMAANFVVMTVALPFVYKPMPIEHLGYLAILAVFSWIASRLVIAAYQSGEAGVIAPMQYSQIIWASIFGLLFFGEKVDAGTMIGAGIIIASGLYILMRETGAGNSENTPVLRTRSRSETGTTPRVSIFMRMAGKTPPRQD